MDDDTVKLEHLTERKDLLARSCLCTDGFCDACNAVANRIAELEEEQESMRDLIQQQMRQLHEVMNAIRGEPVPPSALWSTHDAPERVQQLVNDLANIRAELTELRDHWHAEAATDYAREIDQILRERR